MYNIKERQIEKALQKHKERPFLIELMQKNGVTLSSKEIENILIFGDIRGPYFLNDEEFSDFEVLKELLENPDLD